MVTRVHALLRGLLLSWHSEIYFLCSDCPHGSCWLQVAGSTSFMSMAFGISMARSYPCGRQHNNAAKMSSPETLEPMTIFCRCGELWIFRWRLPSSRSPGKTVAGLPSSQRGLSYLERHFPRSVTTVWSRAAWLECVFSCCSAFCSCPGLHRVLGKSLKQSDCHEVAWLTVPQSNTTLHLLYCDGSASIPPGFMIRMSTGMRLTY